MSGRDRAGVGDIGFACLTLSVLLPKFMVLCSIPNGKQHLSDLKSLLRPGGQLLLFEHVACADLIIAMLQIVYNPIWRPFDELHRQ